MKWLKIILFFLSFFSSLLVVELVVRLLDIKPPIFKVESSSVKLSEDPILGYVLNESYPGINSFGLKNKEITISKENQSFRILVIGDSVTYGCCDDFIEPFPQILDKKLEQLQHEGKQVEVINGGVVGYNTVQEAELFHSKLKQLNPDLVILQVTVNDWEPKNYEFIDLLKNLDSDKQSSARDYYNLNEKFYLFTKHSRLMQNLLYWQTVFKNSHNKTQPVNYFQDSIKNFQKTNVLSDGFTQLEQDASSEHIPVLTVMFPSFQDITNYSSDFSAIHQYVSELSSKANFRFLDLLSCYKEDYEMNKKDFKRDPLASRGDTIHPN